MGLESRAVLPGRKTGALVDIENWDRDWDWD